MKTIEVFDPPMCCSTGVCGPEVNSELVEFSASLDWLSRHDVEIRRYNLAQQPAEFIKNETVKAALSQGGENPLPLILLDGKIVEKGRYPSREELTALSGIRIKT